MHQCSAGSCYQRWLWSLRSKVSVSPPPAHRPCSWCRHPDRKACAHSQQWHKVGIIEFRQCAGNVHWTYGHVCVAHTLLCCHSPHACSCACVNPCSTTTAHQHTRAHTHVVSGHFSISELRVIGVDTKHWWSNGLTIRGETEPPKRHQFTTVKGERDGSDVVFPGVYTYEAGRGRHGSGDGGRLWQCSGDGCYASVCSVLLTVGG